MNVILLVLSAVENISDRGIYSDLVRKFRDEGHHVYVVKALERRHHKDTTLEVVEGIDFLKVKTLNIRATNIVEKGLSTITIEMLFKKAIKEYFKDVKFDLILYTTPPITFLNVVKYLKKNNPQAVSYLLLKDIFPQNAVDIGMFGEKSVFNWYFRKKEKALYEASDFIGCMSPANVEFVLRHNDFIDKNRVEVAPNSIELEPESEEQNDPGQVKAAKYYIRTKYNLPNDKPIFVYGGNLGKPQGIDYLIKCLEANKKRQDCFFLVVGNGTEYKKLNNWYIENKDSCVKVMQRLPKEDYDMLVRHCDVGLIFLDHRFTIPNYPSRLLSYLKYKMPVICATDVNTDIGKIAEKNGYGYWCESVNPADFTALVEKILAADRKAMGEKGYQFLKENYLVEHTYNAIMKHFA